MNNVPLSKNVLPAPTRPKPKPKTQQALNINVNVGNLSTLKDLDRVAKMDRVLANIERVAGKYKKRNADTVITINISLNY